MAYEAIRKNLHFCDLEDKKEKRRASISKNNLFCLMLEQAIKNEVKFEYVLADSWFGSKKNLEYINH